MSRTLAGICGSQLRSMLGVSGKGVVRALQYGAGHTGAFFQTGSLPGKMTRREPGWYSTAVGGFEKNSRGARGKREIISQMSLGEVVHEVCRKQVVVEKM